MPNATLPLTSFTGGEWSPRLHGRVDIAKYSTACEVLQNMVIYPHGGVTRRMGMEYIEDAKVQTVRLIPFEYNREQAYVLEFGNGYIRFFRDGGQIAPGGVPLELVTPYTEAEIDSISFCQSNDILFIVHENHHPRRLSRTGEDTFSLTEIPFVNTGAPAGSSKKLPNDWITERIIDGVSSFVYKYPRTVTLFQSRLVFGGISTKPQTIWMSKANDLYNFTTGSAANDAQTWTLSSTQNNSIQWLVPVAKLMIGTTGGEFSLDLPGNTATNIQVRRESNFGSKDGRTQLIGNGVIYASRDGRKVREMAYSFEADGFVSPELSLLSEHLTRPGIKEFDYAQNPDGILWTVMNDGTFSGFTYLKSQEVQGWHRHQTQGEVISICTIEGVTGSEVWFAVKRGLGDNYKVRIERMAPAFDGESPNDLACAYLDSYLTYEGDPVDNLSGLDHLEGMTVSILADGYYLSDKVVTGGAITLEREFSRIIVGLKYGWRLVPLRLEGGSPTGFSQGKKKRVVDIVARFERSAGIEYKIPGRDFTSLLPTRQYGQNYGEPISFFSGDKEIKLPNSWDRNGQFELKGDSPFPVTILMIAANLSVNE